MLRVFALLGALMAAAFAQQVRVLSYNIHHGEGVDGRFDLERIAAVIRSADPDLAAIQEVDVRTVRSSGVDQADALARLTGMQVAFGHTIMHQGGLYGNAVLSKWPMDGFTTHALPGSEGRERRGAIEVRMSRPIPFTFLATHLDIAEKDRVMAANALRSLIRNEQPMILAGDLNAVEGSEPMKILLQDWMVARLDAPLPTIPVEKPARQIDYVLYRPAARWRVIEARVLDERVASDHRPILVVLELMRN